MWIPQKNENCPREGNSPEKAETRAQKAGSIRLKFPKGVRILSRKHYRTVLKRAQKFEGRFIHIDYQRGKSLCAKLGISVSKRYGKSHIRNYFKRLTREAFRQCYAFFPKDIELNVVPQSKNLKISKKAIEEDFLTFLKNC